MERKEAIRSAYRLTGSSSFYDGMMTCSTLPGRLVCRLVWDKHLELSRKEKKDTPMLKKTENQYKKHALKYAEWAKSIYGCKTLDDCRAHIQDYYSVVHTVPGRKASDCLKCGKCEKVCPQHMPIRKLLEDVAKEFEKA